MVPIFSTLLTIASAIVATVVAVFFVEVVVAVTLGRRYNELPSDKTFDIAARIAVLVPAHNESAGLLPTLEDIKRQLRNGDRVLVVADNCSDDTAAIARTAGAEVTERHDPVKLGKGYALDFGLQQLSAEPPDIVIMVDADCRLGDNTINALAKTCVATRRPVQALDLMTAPAKSQINQKVAEFAWRVKNWLRPTGLMALGLPCQLMGTGMAFPWDVIRRANLASSLIVEDLKLGLDLTSKGFPPVFCPSARVTSEFATSAKAAETQRKRWEGGHIGMILSTVPRLLFKSVARMDWNLLALTLDLAVPPLSLLAMLVIGIFAVTALFALLAIPSWSLILSAVALFAFWLAACLAWLQCGRDVVPLNAILSLVPYVLSKFGLYHSILFRKPNAPWIRTDRTKAE